MRSLMFCTLETHESDGGENNKSYKEFFGEMIKNLLIWLENDRAYVEKFVLNNFCKNLKF